MKKIKPIIAKNASELADVLGLGKSDVNEITLRSELNTKIIDIVKKEQLTHEQLAKIVKCPRTRITALLNRNRQSISTDFMIKVLNSLGYYIKPTFCRYKAATG